MGLFSFKPQQVVCYIPVMKKKHNLKKSLVVIVCQKYVWMPQDTCGCKKKNYRTILSHLNRSCILVKVREENCTHCLLFSVPSALYIFGLTSDIYIAS